VTQSETLAGPVRDVRQGVRIVDADVHPWFLPQTVSARLNEPWRTRFERYGPRVAKPPALYPRVRNAGYRLDSWPEGGFPGSDPELARRQLLDEHAVDYAILIPLQGHGYGAEGADFGAALCSAVNDAVREDWLDLEPRLRSSICITHETPSLAVAEIERHAGDPRFVQVLLPTGTESPLGDRKYWPIFEAAAAAGLPICVHTGGLVQHRGPGWPSYYLEEHVWNGNAMQAAALSLVCEGAFARIPALQAILVEAGVTWANPLMWALDAAWEKLRDEVPFVERPPSEYFREHCWFTTQPIEEPEDPAQLVQALELMGMTDRIMFASDYPHWDFDAPAMTLPRAVPEQLKSAIMAGNACRLYGLGAPAQVSA
jgi:predicted TIM-barrel fold metal-dependent hydrolase